MEARVDVVGANLTHRFGDLEIAEPVRQVGSYHVNARLHRTVTATITVEVRALGSA